jgi:uncharacterized protein
MAGLAIASFVESGLALHWVPESQTGKVGLILLAVPFTLQLIACLFSYLARDGAAGASLGVLATTWLAVGLVHISSIPAHISGALGLLLLASAAMLALSGAAVARAKPLPALVFLASALRFALDGIYQLSGTASWQHAAGVVGLVITGAAAYGLVAFELEGQARSPILPTFRRSRGRAAVGDGMTSQLDGIEHEAGVRQTT